MYAIHTTPGFILYSRPKSEAGKLLYIFTRDLGLIVASAQGIRLEKSKLRHYCQEFSLAQFSFVKGKEFWKLTNAQNIDTNIRISRILQIGSEANTNLRDIIPRCALLLRRLLHGEEAHIELFDHIQASLYFIAQYSVTGTLSDDQIKTLESVVVFRIVSLLGYIGDDKTIDHYVRTHDITVEMLDRIAHQKVVMNKHINKALMESQL